MRRREFIAALGGAAAWPVAARAQRAAAPIRIGFLGSTLPSGYAAQVERFRTALRDLGYVEGKDVVIEYLWADGDYTRLPSLAAALIQAKVDVIVTHGTPGGLAAKAATATIPIVIGTIGDPLASGIVTNLARPGGNITGQSFFAAELTAKWVELIKEVMPRTTRLALLLNPDNPFNVGLPKPELELTARTHNVTLHRFHARAPDEFERVFENMVAERIEAVVIDDDAMLNANARSLAPLAFTRRLASIGNRTVPHAGGLLGYGVDFPAMWGRAAAMVDKVLKGTSPADIPFERATRFEMVINLKTAKALGIAIPPTLIARADEVIE